MMQPYEDTPVSLADMDWQEVEAQVQTMTREELEQAVARLASDVRYYRACANKAERGFRQAQVVVAQYVERAAEIARGEVK